MEKNFKMKSDLQSAINAFLTTSTCCEPRLALTATDQETNSPSNPVHRAQELLRSYSAVFQGMSKLILFPYSSAPWIPVEMKYLHK